MIPINKTLQRSKLQQKKHKIINFDERLVVLEQDIWARQLAQPHPEDFNLQLKVFSSSTGRIFFALINSYSRNGGHENFLKSQFIIS